MVYELADAEKATALFEGWSETLIWSCLQRVMGKNIRDKFRKASFRSCFCRVLCLLWRRAGSRACNALLISKQNHSVIQTE